MFTSRTQAIHEARGGYIKVHSFAFIHCIIYAATSHAITKRRIIVAVVIAQVEHFQHAAKQRPVPFES